MPRKTDSHNPADWLWIAARDLVALGAMAAQELGYELCRSKLAEVLEKIFKAELLRQGWMLEKTHDLRKLGGEVASRDQELGEEIRPLVAALAEAYFTARYPGFDFDDPDWATLRAQTAAAAKLLKKAQARLGTDTP